MKSHTRPVLQCSQFFRLAELVGKYTSRLKQLGENTPACIHTTCLKDRILSQISALEEHKQGCDVFFLAFKNDLANVLQNAHKEDSAEEAIHLVKAASIARKEHKNTNLTDLLKRIARLTPVPPSLVSLVNMILYGPNIEVSSLKLVLPSLSYNSYQQEQL